MAVELVGTHRSKDAERSIEERLVGVNDLQNLIFFGSNDPVEIIASRCDGQHEVGSLREALQALTVAELRETLRRHGVQRVPQGPKARLVDLALRDVLPTGAEGFMAEITPYGPDRVAWLRALVAEGGRREVRKNEVTLADDVPAPDFPTTMLFDLGTCFVEVVPKEAQEILGSLSDDAWASYERLAQDCSSALRFLAAAADLRGVVRTDDAFEEWAARCGKKDADAVQTILCNPGPWLDEADVAIISDGNASYAMCGTLVTIVVDESQTPDEAAIDALLAAHEANEPCPVSDALLASKDVMWYVLSMPEAKDMVAFLDEHVPDGINDALFAPGITMRLIVELRAHDAWRRVDDLFAEQGLRLTGFVAERVRQLSERLNRVVPKWHLNGWTLAQTDERQGKSPAVLTLVEGGGSKEGGYVWVDSEDDDLGAFPDPEAQEFDAEEIVEQNDTYLDEFEAWLTKSGLKPKTVRNHVSNLEFYLNGYLAYYECVPMPYGCGYVDSFLGEYFIRKAMWSTPGTIRSMAASIKKFYKCMCELGHISKQELSTLLSTIKAGLPEWCELCADYNDPYTDNPFALW